MKWFVAALAFFATTATAELSIKYLESALFMTVARGQQAAKVVCLENGNAPSEGLPAGWVVLTCNNIDSPKRWHVCYANVEKRSFICGKFNPA